METITIEIQNPTAKLMLEEMEKLELVKLIDPIKEIPKSKLSEKYAGKLPIEVAEQLNEYVNNSRQQWNREII